MKKSTKTTIDFLKTKKTELKENKYRQKFDKIASELKERLVDTTVVKNKVDQTTTNYIVSTIRPDGSTDWMEFPSVKATESSGNVPRASEPIAFSKILVAASAISSKAPDGQVFSTNKIKARAYYALLKRSWTHPEMNGHNTLSFTTQNVLTYGWAAWRQSPKQTVIDKTIDGIKTKKLVYNDIFREPLDPNRTWLGTSYKASVNDNRPEVLFELDVTREQYSKLKKRFGIKGKKTDVLAGVSQEAITEDANKSKTHVTISFYEAPLDNRYIIASDADVFYDDEIPNDELYGTVFIAQCFSKDMNDPYGVGLYELIRGNEAIYNYINSLNAEQVEAEIFPLLFMSGSTGQGDLTFTRSPNKLNTIPQGATIDKVSTSGNATLGINYANAQKQNIEDNTGVNNIVAGSSSETTLGATVILKEAALNRLIKPRNSVAQAIENDAIVFFSQIEQYQMYPNKFVFSTPEEVKAFMQANPNYEHDLDETEYGVEVNDQEEDLQEPTGDEDSTDMLPVQQTPKQYTVLSSERVPMDFDYSQPLLEESDYENQNISEYGDAKFSIAKSKLLQSVNKLQDPDKLGYDRVFFKVDSNSMLIPSIEIQKQTSAQLYPLIQNTLQIIYGLARQDPEQAVAQLKSFETFLDKQKENIYDYVPKDQYDQIISMSFAQPQDPMMAMMQGQATQADGTPVTQPQDPTEMPQQPSPFASAMSASVGRAANGNKVK